MLDLLNLLLVRFGASEVSASENASASRCGAAPNPAENPDQQNAVGLENVRTDRDRAALEQYLKLQGELNELRSYGGASSKDELTGRSTRARAGSPRPSSIPVSLWGRMTPKQKEEKEIELGSRRAQIRRELEVLREGNPHINFDAGKALAGHPPPLFLNPSIYQTF